jgi:hypothetical protein
MIGKITIGKSFGGCIKYCLEDKINDQNQVQIKNRAEVLMYSKCYGDGKELVQQFNEVRQLNTGLAKPVFHITLSLAPGENLGKDKLMEMCEECAKEMGFENNQFIAVSHRDTNHQHIHIVANRIGFDTRTVSDSNNYQKITNYCRKMELKYDLQKVLNPRKYLPKEQRNLPRYDQRKEKLRQHIKEALKGCKEFAQFEQKMKERGYEITKGRGISFTDEKKVKVKGSELNYSLQTIERILQKQNVLPLKEADGNIPSDKQPNRIAVGFNPDFSSTNNNLKQEILLEQLLKPEQTNDELSKDLLPKKRKKKQGKSRRL